jgi:hypothetical protein
LTYQQDGASLHLHIATQAGFLGRMFPRRGESRGGPFTWPLVPFTLHHAISSYSRSTQRVLFAFHCCQLLFIPLPLPSEECYVKIVYISSVHSVLSSYSRIILQVVSSIKVFLRNVLRIYQLAIFHLKIPDLITIRMAIINLKNLLVAKIIYRVTQCFLSSFIYSCHNHRYQK